MTLGKQFYQCPGLKLEAIGGGSRGGRLVGQQRGLSSPLGLSGPNRDPLLRLNFSTPTSTNIVSVCRAAGLGAGDRVEITRRYLLSVRWKAISFGGSGGGEGSGIRDCVLNPRE